MHLPRLQPCTYLAGKVALRADRNYPCESEMANDFTLRRELVARAFADRRAELGLTQEKVAQRADIALRTVANFESQGRWPSKRTRERIEEAVGWPLGTIERLADKPQPVLDPKLVEWISGLTDDETEALIRLAHEQLRQSRDEDHPQRNAASG